MIGMPGLIEFDSIDKNIELAKTLGLDFLELNMNLPVYSYLMDVETVSRKLKASGLKVSLHLSETFDPFELDPIIRKARLETFRQSVKLAEKLGAFLINMHLSKGIHFTLPDKKLQLYEQFQSEYLRNVYAFKDILDHTPLRVCIENTGIHHLDYIQRATDILLASENVFLTYDIGHDITSGYKDKAYYEKHSDKIVHYHIHDGTATANHLELYTGDLDIDGFLCKASDTDASVVIEVKSRKQLENSIRKIRKPQ